MAKGWALSTSNLIRVGLPRNSVDRITDRPAMTSAVDHGRKALTQLNNFQFWFEGGIWVLIVSVPSLSILFTYIRG